MQPVGEDINEINTMKQNNICIVTPDVVGPIKNGGIGTHCFYLARVLADAGCDVTILFTGPLQNKTHRFWQSYYSGLGIQYCSIEHDEKVHLMKGEKFIKISYLVYKFLRERDFDYVHFQEWMANGFISTQAKLTTQDFNNTILTTTLHSSTEWQNEGMYVWNNNPLGTAKLQWAEMYCAQNSDILISPSRYMFDWADKHGWLRPEKSTVLPYCYLNNKNKFETKTIDKNHLIFFGRLETRKGIKEFVDSLLWTLEYGDTDINKVTFIGKNGSVSGISAKNYIKRSLRNKILYDIKDDLDTFEALAYIKKTAGLVVIPSVIDNFPYTVIECIENNIPFLCAGTGGLPEMVDENVIFDIYDRTTLGKKIAQGTDDLFLGVTHKYDAVQAHSEWLSLHKEVRPVEEQEYLEPLVSICIPYYEHPQYLPNLLASIEASDYNNYEVIIVNDGSRTKLANTTFNDMRQKYKTRFLFLQQDNQGIGCARNYAASEANGDYLIFMDADNLAKPNMIKDFVKAIQISNSDCVTCHFDAFHEKLNKPEKGDVLYRYIPLGPSLELGMLENIFGDANFIIKTDVFKEIGGFSNEKKLSWEDWEFLAKLNLKGYRQQVVPKSLFWYRHTMSGFSRTTNNYLNQARILRAYEENQPLYLRRVVNQILVPYHLGNSLTPRNILRYAIDKARYIVTKISCRLNLTK